MRLIDFLKGRHIHDFRETVEEEYEGRGWGWEGDPTTYAFYSTYSIRRCSYPGCNEVRKKFLYSRHEALPLYDDYPE